MPINTNLNPNEGILIASSTVSQRASYSSGIYGSSYGNFTNKYLTDTNIKASNRHQIAQAWETNNIYRISGNQVIKTSFDGTALATSTISLNNPKSICVNQRMLLPVNPSDYIEESGCVVVDLDPLNHYNIIFFDSDLNVLLSIVPDPTTIAGSKIHIIPSFTGTSNSYDSYRKFAIIYSKNGDESFWYIRYCDYSNLLSGFSYLCHGVFSEDYCAFSGSSYCFPMDDRTPAFLIGTKLWMMTSRVDGSTNFTREKIQVFDVSSVSQGLLYKTIDPLYDMFGSGADYNVMADMDINYSVPNFVLITGGCQNAAWVARYSNAGNFISKLDTSVGELVDMPTAIKCVQNPTSTFFYLLTENDYVYFPTICDDSSSSSSLSSSSLSSRSSISSGSSSISSTSDTSSSSDYYWTVSNPINYFNALTIASSNTNGIIYVGGVTQFPHYGHQAKLYKSTNQVAFTDITPYAEIAANAHSYSNLSTKTWIFEVKCDASGQYILLGLGGVSGLVPDSHSPAEILLSNDYGSTWSVVVGYTSFIGPDTPTNNALYISQYGDKMAIHYGSNSDPAIGTDDYVCFNNSYGLGSWRQKNLFEVHNSHNNNSIEHNRVFLNDNTDEIYCLANYTYFDGSNYKNMPISVYSSDFGVSWLNHGNVISFANVSTFWNRHNTFAVASSDLTQMVIGEYLDKVNELWNISNASSNSTTSNLFAALYPSLDTTFQAICDKTCSEIYIVDPAGYSGIQRGYRSGVSWTLKQISPGTIPIATAISGAKSSELGFEHICVTTVTPIDNEGNIKSLVYTR